MDEATNFVLNRGTSKGVHTLDKIRLLLEEFDNPQDKIRTIHIAGTNGKGSTTKMIAKVLASKNKTATFTSPYIRRINEAIAINGCDISDDEFIDLVKKIKKPIENLDNKGYYLSYFEVLTAMAYIFFYEQKVDVAIIETGLGGLLDCTNIIKKPLASVITTISMDHMNILGNSIEEIAYQKAGIIKKDCPVFIYPNNQIAMQVFSKKVDETNSASFTFNKDEVNIKQADDKANVFDFRNYKDVKLKLLGKHQIYNACLALLILDHFKKDFNIDEKIIKESLENTENIGRLTTISSNPRVIVDGSHNKEAIDALIDTIRNFSYDRLIIGFSVLGDKDYEYIIRRLSEIADELVVTSIDNPRAFDFDELSKITKEKFKSAIAIEDNKKAYEYSKSICNRNDLVLWCGSFYLISDIISYQSEDQ
jgi:bifunctional protein folC